MREIKFKTYWYRNKAEQGWIYWDISEQPPHHDEIDWTLVRQFTGEKDSQGADIYEGDIVEYSTSGGSKSLGVVTFNKEQYAGLPAFHITNKDGVSVDYYYGVPAGYTEKVVGNDYEHAYLLEPSTTLTGEVTYE